MADDFFIRPTAKIGRLLAAHPEWDATVMITAAGTEVKVKQEHADACQKALEELL